MIEKQFPKFRSLLCIDELDGPRSPFCLVAVKSSDLIFQKWFPVRGMVTGLSIKPRTFHMSVIWICLKEMWYCMMQHSRNLRVFKGQMLSIIFINPVGITYELVFMEIKCSNLCLKMCDHALVAQHTWASQIKGRVNSKTFVLRCISLVERITL